MLHKIKFFCSLATLILLLMFFMPMIALGQNDGVGAGLGTGQCQGAGLGREECEAAGSGGGDYGLGTTAAGAGLTSGSLPGILGQIAGAALSLSGVALLAMIVLGGFFMLTSAGDEKKYKKGKDIITWAIIGILVLGAAYAISIFVIGIISQGATPR